VRAGCVYGFLEKTAFRKRLEGILQELNGIEKRALIRARDGKNIPQGLKPTLILLAFLPGINPRPTARMSLFRSRLIASS
jgi:hypothetical protein